MCGKRVQMNTILAPLLLSFLLWGSLAACGAENPNSVPGITEPFFDVTLSASVPGIISVQKFKEGDWVKEGDVILELDKKLEELEASRRKLVEDTRKIDLDATRVLFQSTKAISKEELEKKVVEYKVAVVEREMAAEQLRKRLIAAPISGTITEITLDVGEACQPYQPLVRLVDTRQCYFVSSLEAQAASRLKLNQTVKLEIETGGPPIVVAAKLIFLSPVVDPGSGLTRVKAIFDNRDGKVRAGIAGRILFE